jgi:hypothetical protein
MKKHGYIPGVALNSGGGRDADGKRGPEGGEMCNTEVQDTAKRPPKGKGKAWKIKQGERETERAPSAFCGGCVGY